MYILVYEEEVMNEDHRLNMIYWRYHQGRTSENVGGYQEVFAEDKKETKDKDPPCKCKSCKCDK
jgi:hypothetical protein